MKTLFFCLFLVLLTNCATLNEDECRTGDWYGQGLKNGREGRNLLSAHTKACSEYGINPNIAEYTKGFGAGIKSYCTPENGYRVGVEGKTYQKVCPIRMEKAFLAKYRLGKKIYDNIQTLNTLNSELQNLESKLASTTGEQYNRDQIKNQIYSKRSEISRVKKKIIFLKAQSGYDMEDIVDYF
ncbi:MAG: hypothetical protein CME70_17130 [Halobacteriovorax sp.]|nr:hypothetical protein [Halobacteriovorax sp.]|tara:strand:- start:108032 stop:108580 length:549 start_codon:yes stop_codon:yes gene_type:complete